MRLTKLKLQNYKRFRSLEIDFNDGVNILVGQNDAGKSTVMEAIHLAITGLLGGRHLRNELSQHLFNNEAVNEYLESLKKPPHLPPPSILIELHLTNDFPLFLGNDNSDSADATGFYLRVYFDEVYQPEYETLVAAKALLTLPIEYYAMQIKTFARDQITPRTTPMKSALIDSSAARYQNGSDVYVSKIIRDFLDKEDIVGISQAYRRMKETFRIDPSIDSVNAKMKKAPEISSKVVTLSAELPAKSDWEDSLVTCVDEVPFHFVGKGEQSLIKTKLALIAKRAVDATILLLEEPENHLTHASLNKLLHHVSTSTPNRQIIISTHSSFVANKLGLKSLVFLNNAMTTRLTDLDKTTQTFFEKIAGYDTLRLILSKRSILVEGDSDELVVQKAYHRKHGKLPIEDGIDVLSVGTSFLRFLEIADRLEQPVTVVTDNDGDTAALRKKYTDYIGPAAKPYAKICFDDTVDTGPDIGGKPFNYNTLEPKFLKANTLKSMNKILGTSCADDTEMHKYMRANKTDCALRIFETTEEVKFPQYILDAVM